MSELMPEQYELIERAKFETAAPVSEWNRRNFFKALGCGVLAVFVAPAVAQRAGGRAPSALSAWLHIAEDGTITVFSGKTEVGQNIRTSLAQAVAEELRVPISAIMMTLADTQLVPYDAGTFGSQSTPQMGSRLRAVAAAAREALIDLAAAHFNADRASLKVADGKISNGSASIGFGELAKGRELAREVSNAAPVTAAKDWKICGTSVAKVNGRDFVTGKHKFTSDMKLPGMLHGKVLRPPAFDATLTSINANDAEAVYGAKVHRDGNFVGIAAKDVLTATKAMKSIRAEWQTTQQPFHTELFEILKKTGSQASGGGRGGGSPTGSIQEGLARADHKIQQTYTIAYIAHTPLEPRAAVAKWDGDAVTVWTGTQRPFGVRGDVARALGIPEEKVRVIVPDTGSGFGGKHTVETATEAARLARAVGKPVKIVWTREEEFTWAYFRPAGVIEITAGATNDGKLTAWEFHNYNSGGSAIRTPYDVPNTKHEFHASKSPLKQGSYRALAATANHFARECAMDELAVLLNADPLEFRLKNLKEPRMRAVLEAAAEKFGWAGRKGTRERGFGLAVGTEKGSCVSTMVEIAIIGKKVKVVRAVTAFECGAVVNPEHLKNQIEGSVVMGIGGALYEEVLFGNGRMLNPFLADYRVPRFSDTPKMETVLLDRKDLPSVGGSETPIVAIAPAIGNAIYSATGTRHRSLPMRA